MERDPDSGKNTEKWSGDQWVTFVKFLLWNCLSLRMTSISRFCSKHVFAPISQNGSNISSANSIKVAGKGSDLSIKWHFYRPIRGNIADRNLIRQVGHLLFGIWRSYFHSWTSVPISLLRWKCVHRCDTQASCLNIKTDTCCVLWPEWFIMTEEDEEADRLIAYCCLTPCQLCGSEQGKVSLGKVNYAGSRLSSLVSAGKGR